MRRFRWPLLLALICTPLGLLVWGVRLPGLGPTRYAAPLPVPDDDQEVAWFHTTTSAANWERFVTGVKRATHMLPGLTADDSGAFLDQTTAVPEVVLGYPGRPGKLRIRWYKLNSEHRPEFWVNALADRARPPLAVIGGGSSDRARDMAGALALRAEWRGDRPLFLITTASAETVFTDGDATDRHGHAETQLLKIYDRRSFRFCFSNRQMAEAMLDFVWRSPGLRPQAFSAIAAQAVGSGLLARQTQHAPTCFNVVWDDDPFSSDLLDMVKQELPGVLSRHGVPVSPNHSGWHVPFSVGGYHRPNRAEEAAADAMLQELARQPPQRSVLVLPTVPAPARRFLRTLAEARPGVGHELVALNGDGMGVNTILRDGEFAWPVHALPVPIVLFTHANPVGWDEDTSAVPENSRLKAPNSTEEVLHFAELVRTLAAAAFGVPPDGPPLPGTLVESADELATRLRERSPAFFDADGNRLGGTGEFVFVVRPQDDRHDRGLPDAVIEVWRRGTDRTWTRVRTETLDQSRARTGLRLTKPTGGRG